MQEVKQGEAITIDVRFYDAEPSAGGVPVDPDGWLHAWDILNDLNNRMSAITLLEAGTWPVSGTTYYFSIIDSGTDFEVIGYDDAGRTNAIVSTGTLSYGVYSGQQLAEVAGSGYAGTISLTFPGIGGGVEDFEITDVGTTQPTYEIIDQNNVTVVAATLFTTQITVGHFQVSYNVSITATPGENWRLVARGTISGIDTFVNVYFKVLDAADVVDEAAKLITLTELKQGMDKTSAEDDTLLESMILSASKAVEEWCMQLFHLESRLAYFDGPGHAQIFFDDAGPIYCVSKLEYSDTAGVAWAEIDLSTVAVQSWFLARLDGNIFDEGLSNWRITYIAGALRAPSVVRRAVIELIRFWYYTRDRHDSKSNQMGSLKVDYNALPSNLPPVVVQMLRPHRRLG